MTSTQRSPPPLSSNVRWTLLGSVAVAASNWLLVVILARASGSVALGHYAFALALTAPVMSFAGLQMRTLLASDVTHRYALPEYLRVTAWASSAGVLACLALAAASGDAGEVWTILGAVCVMRVSDLFGEVYSGQWQRREQMRVIGVARVIQAVVSIGGAATAAWLGAGALEVAIAGALGSVAQVAYLHRYTARDPGAWITAADGDPRLARARVIRLAVEGLPLGLILLLSVLQSNVPRYFIEASAGVADLGLFAAASQLTTAGNVLIAALGSAALPRLAGWYASGSPSFYKLTWKLVLAGAGLGLAGTALSAVAGRQFLTIVYGAEFAVAERTLVILSLAAGLWFMASFLGIALTAGRIIKAQPAILMAALAVLVAGSAYLVPRYGSPGAAWAQVAGSGVHALASVVVLRRLRRVQA